MIVLIENLRSLGNLRILVIFPILPKFLKLLKLTISAPLIYPIYLTK